jgi:hypothetical protein
VIASARWIEYKLEPMKQHPRLTRALHLLPGACALWLIAAGADESKNYFNDPFVQVTSAVPACPAPAGPLISAAEVRQVEHERTQHGTSCYLSGRCRLPNSYLYDKEIIPRVAQYIQRDGRFDDTSVWIMGQRRIVTLMGCVQSREQADALEKSVALVDDVMNVVNKLMVGSQGQAPYPLRAGH